MSRSPEGSARTRRSPAARGIARLAVALVVGACSAEPTPPNVLTVGADVGPRIAPPPETPTRAWLGPQGGRVASADEACRAVVPEGALPREAWVSFETLADGSLFLTWQGITLLRPIVIQCLPPSGRETFGLRLERTGFGSSDQERLPTPASGPDGWLSTWTWREGRLRWTESACSPGGPHGQPICLADPRERCLMAPGPPLVSACGFGCTVDAECPVGHACHGGRCEPKPCGRQDECRETEVCAGVEGLRFCVPALGPRDCAAGCDAGERCVRTSSGAQALAQCGRPFVGCVGTSRACPVVTFDAFEGIERPGRPAEDPAWVLGARLSDVQGTVVPFVNPADSPGNCEPNFRGRTGFAWWDDARFGGAIFSINDCGDDRHRPVPPPQMIQRRLSLFAMPPIRDVQPRVGSAGEAVVAWTAPRAGRVRLDLGLVASGNEVMSSRAVAARMDHRSGSRRQVRFGGRTFVAHDGGVELRARDELMILEGDTLELSFPSTVGSLITQSQTYLDWQVTYLEAR